jgi:flagellar hook-associated protein 3 FlgL
MALRVTNNAQIDRSIYDIQVNHARLERVQQDISTGKRIHRPSDDPTANARAMVLRSSMAQNEQYQSNIQSTRNFVQVTDTSTTNYINALQRLRTLALQGAGGHLRAEEKGAIIQEVTSLKEEIRAIANTELNGRYIFGGMANDAVKDQQPIPSLTFAAANNVGKLEVEIAPGMTVQYNTTTTELFGSTMPDQNGNYQDVFGMIDNFVALLGQDTSTPDISNIVVQDIDNFLTQAGTVRTQIGGLINRLDVADERIESINAELENFLNNTEATDIASASLLMNQNEATFRAALSVGARAIPLSLVDFLR